MPDRSPGGDNETVRGQPQTMPPESLTVKRKPPKTKAERKGDCNSRYTAEQLRLNPMLAMEDEEEEKKPKLTAEQKRLNPLAGGGEIAPAAKPGKKQSSMQDAIN